MRNLLLRLAFAPRHCSVLVCVNCTCGTTNPDPLLPPLLDSSCFIGTRIMAVVWHIVEVPYVMIMKAHVHGVRTSAWPPCPQIFSTIHAGRWTVKVPN
jgi:hypothetical protein